MNTEKSGQKTDNEQIIKDDQKINGGQTINTDQEENGSQIISTDQKTDGGQTINTGQTVNGGSKKVDHVTRISRKLVYKANILDIYDDEVLTPEGYVAHWDFIGHKGAAAVVAVRDDKKLVMVRQYRNALDRETIELPAGARDYVGEPTLECAVRELKEETGYTAGKMEYLMTVRTAIAYCNELIDIYVATDLRKGEQHLDADEVINVQAFDIEDLCSMVYRGELQDVKTIAALFAYKNKYLKN